MVPFFFYLALVFMESFVEADTTAISAILGLALNILALVISIIINIDLAKKFGKSPAFSIGLILLPIVFLPILAFGDARYQGRVDTPPSPVVPTP